MTNSSLARKKKKITYTVCTQGIEIAEKALKRLGFESKSNFAASQLLARSTVTKFFNCQPIQLDSFKRICNALKLNWAEIAGIIEKEQSDSLEINSYSSPDTHEKVEPVPILRRQVTVIDKQSKKIKTVITLKGDVNSIENREILELILRQNSGNSINIIDIQEGSIRLILEGSQADIERLVSRIQSGEIPELSGFPVEDIQILKESSDDESNELNDKWHLVQEIVTQPTKMRKLSCVDLSDTDLSGVNLGSADLGSADLSNANLSDADLSSANLSSADLSNADLSNADLSSADLSSADLSNADLSNADLIYANIIHADLSGANLSHADLSHTDLSGANLSRANLSGTNLIHADLSGANLSHANLSDAFLNHTSLSGANLNRANLNDTDLSSADLSNADLSDAHLKLANLSSANLSHANLSSANLSGGNLSRASLSGAYLKLTDLSDTNLIRAYLKLADLSSANLNNANLSSANLIHANLSDTTLIRANLNNANLNNADLNGANLSDATLIRANLNNANLNNADLNGTNLSGTDGSTVATLTNNLYKKGLSLYDISYTEQLIMYALYHRELYGLAIQDHVKRASNNEIKIDVGSLYPALAKLERKGLVTSRWGENRPIERRGARRKYYTLTSKGITMSDEIFAFYNQLKYVYPIG